MVAGTSLLQRVSLEGQHKDFTDLFMAKISATLMSTLPHLNQTLEKTKLLMDQGRIVSSMNLSARQELMMLDTCCWTWSPLDFLVCFHVAFSWTPSGRNLHFWLKGSRWRRQPEAASNKVWIRKFNTIVKFKSGCSRLWFQAMYSNLDNLDILSNMFLC